MKWENLITPKLQSWLNSPHPSSCEDESACMCSVIASVAAQGINVCASLFQCKYYIVCIIPSLDWKVQVINEMNIWFFLFKMNCQWAKLLFSCLVGFMIFWYFGSVFPPSLEAENIFHAFWYLSLYFPNNSNNNKKR